MKKMNYALLVLLALVLVSCSAYKQVPYLQASEYLDTSGQNPPLYDARIMPKDLLTITVNTTDPETAAPFNLIVATTLSNQNKIFAVFLKIKISFLKSMMNKMS